MRDITLRAIDTLKEVDIILCEDTRVTGKLLKALDINVKMQIYNDHTDESQRGKIIALIAAGKKLALVSDAGTPLINDPGYKLARDCMDAGHYVTTLPGANAPLSALQLSGLPSDCFTFAGFVPTKTKARQDFYSEWKNHKGTLVCFETGPRLAASLSDLASVMSERSVSVVREITKMFEQTRRGDAASLARFYQDEGAPKGEIVLVIAGAPPLRYSEDDIKAMLREALKTERVKDAAAIVAQTTGMARKELYEMALTLKVDTNS